MVILTFREWKNEHVRVIFDMKHGVKVTSFNKKIIDTKNVEIVKDLKEKQLTLYKFFGNNFDSIQKKYLDLLDKTELVS